MGNGPTGIRIALLMALALLSCKTTGGAEAPKAPEGPPELERIAEWEDRRTLAGGALTALASSPDRVLRERALLALGRIQDAGTAPVVAEALGHPEASTRARAAFAAGLLGLSWLPLPDAPRTLLVTRLLEVEAREPDAAAKAAQLTALGRLGTAPGLARLLERLAPDPVVIDAPGAAPSSGAPATGPSPLSAASASAPASSPRSAAGDPAAAASAPAPSPRSAADSFAGAPAPGPSPRSAAGASAVGSPASDPSAPATGAPAPVPSPRSTAALALGVAVRKGEPMPAGAVALLEPLIDAKDTRYAAAYALAASKSPAARPALLRCLGEPSAEDAEMRALCMKGLTETAQEADVPLLAIRLTDPDYRVVVETVRVLAKAVERCGMLDTCGALAALGGLHGKVTLIEQGDAAGGEQPLLTLAQQGLALRGRPLLLSLRARLNGARLRNGRDLMLAPGVLGDLANLDCSFAAALDRQNAALGEVLTCGFGQVKETRRLSLGLREILKNPAIAQGDRWRPIARHLQHPERGVRLAAMEALAATKAPAAAEGIRPLISDPTDPVLAAAAASAAGALGDTEALPAIRTLAAQVVTNPEVTELAEPIADALVALKGPDTEADLRAWLVVPHAHARITAAKALATLTKAPVPLPEVERVPVPGSPEADSTAAAGREPAETLTFDTEKGRFVIRLDRAFTPRTAGRIAALARRGYFNGITFHRVVPDFVVQGGDPRGDGEGGPGYSMRCEISPRPYLRGTVGMALAGKDTGGSQLFVTTSAQPHLDGRYTVFGEVMEGMDVLDRLLEGDRMLEVRPTP